MMCSTIGKSRARALAIHGRRLRLLLLTLLLLIVSLLFLILVLHVLLILQLLQIFSLILPLSLVLQLQLLILLILLIQLLFVMCCHRRVRVICCRWWPPIAARVNHDSQRCRDPRPRAPARRAARPARKIINAPTRCR